ncbi:MAG: HAD-IB family phosphatase, partial [Pseudomonadota bacterium]
ETRITFTPGGHTLLATMKANGAYAALVSGGFTVFTEQVAAALGFDEHRANTLRMEGERLDGTVAEPILGREAKLERLEAICAERGIALEEAIAVGDGANDLAMIQAAGLGVAFRAKPATAAAADAGITHGDLTGLLFLQGYRREEFVSG